MEEKNVTIVIKKKKVSGHGGHHGGAWKVAFADFMTAMMAFFLVMWLMGADEEVKQSVAAYFKDPSIARDGKSNLGAFSGGDASNKMDGASGRFEEKTLDQPSHAAPVHVEEYSILKDLASYYEGSAFTTDVDDQHVQYKITPRLKFELGSVTISNNLETRTLLVRLIDIFKQHDGTVVIEGFADDKQDWALAFGRAVAVRRLLEQSGVKEDKLVPVAGHETSKDGRIKDVDLKDTGSVRFILKRKRF